IAKRIGVDRDTELNMQFGFANALWFTTGVSDDYVSAWIKVLSLAEATGKVDHQLFALFLLYSAEYTHANMRGALEYADRLGQLAQPSDRAIWGPVADSAMGGARHGMGRFVEAANYLQRASDEPTEHRTDQSSMLRPGSGLTFDDRLIRLLSM